MSIGNLKKDEITLPDGKDAVREVVEHSGGSAILCEKDGKILLNAEESPVVKIYPAVDKLVGFTKVGMDGGLAVFTKKQPEKAKVEFVEKSRTNEYADYEISVTYAPKYDNTFLNFDFSGDGVDVIVDGEKVNDRYYNGYPFEVSLKHHDFPKALTLRVFALKKDDFVYLETGFTGNPAKQATLKIEKAAIKICETVHDDEDVEAQDNEETQTEE